MFAVKHAKLCDVLALVKEESTLRLVAVQVSSGR